MGENITPKQIAEVNSQVLQWEILYTILKENGADAYQYLIDTTGKDTSLDLALGKSGIGKGIRLYDEGRLKYNFTYLDGIKVDGKEVIRALDELHEKGLTFYDVFGGVHLSQRGLYTMLGSNKDYLIALKLSWLEEKCDYPYMIDYFDIVTLARAKMIIKEQSVNSSQNLQQ